MTVTANRNASVLTLAAMQKHRITREAVIFHVAQIERISPIVAGGLVDRFIDGGPCAIVVGAAVFSLIAEARETP